MPRLTDARKELRRAQITAAAVRCFSRKGLERTSIAEITAESGLSAGSIYTHYRNKAELIRSSARAALAEHAEVLGDYAASDVPPGPDDLLARLTSGIDVAKARVAVQIWGEATTDPVIRGVLVDMIDRLRAMVLGCVAAWLVKAEHLEPDRALERAAPIAHRISALYLAEMLTTAMQTPIEESDS